MFAMTATMVLLSNSEDLKTAADDSHDILRKLAKHLKPLKCGRLANTILRVKKKKKNQSICANPVVTLSNYLPPLPTTVAQGVSIGMREDRGIGTGHGTRDGLRHQYVIKLHLFDRL